MLRSARVGLLTVGLMAPAVLAQAPCTDAQAAATAGQWAIDREQAFDTDVPLLRRQYPTLAGTSDRVIALLQQAVPSPRGVSVKVYRTVNGRTLTGSGHVRYGVRALVFSWYCVPVTGSASEFAGKVALDDEAEGDVTVWFNSTGSLTSEHQQVAELQTPDGQRIFYPLVQLDSLRGEALYVPLNAGPRVRRMVLLTSDRASVLRPLTRDELLAARLRYSQARVDTMRAGLVKLRAVPDTTRVMPGARQTLRLLESDVQALVSARSALSLEDRDQPAVVVNAYAPPSTLFVRAADGGKGLVVLKRGVLPRGRPRTEVGLITVEWSWSRSDHAQVEFIGQFTDRFDLGALRRMLTPP